MVIHLLAIAGRIGVDVKLQDFDALGSNIPLLVNLMPSGEYLMEDYYYAGGLPVVLRELKSLLNQNVITVNGHNLSENSADTECYNRDVIASIDTPFKKNAGIAVLTGNLCPDGAVIKPSAASRTLMQHRGKAVVFTSMEDYHKRIDDPDLDIDASSVIVLQGVGPKGYPGMPEVGNVDLPEKLLKEGVRDMVRISDGRMSGTAFGTVVLHVAPESAAGGPLALVRDGDIIELDVKKRTLHLAVSDAELQERLASWSPPPPSTERGYVAVYLNHVEQADKGADLDILKGGSGTDVARDVH
jgi:L-arabonate dehydrase